MNRKYIIAVLIASFVLVVNQVFIQYVLHQKKYDAKTINLAGKQRMLSQKINLEFYKSLEEKQVSPLLPSLFEEWKHTHYTLLNNTRVAKLSPITDPQALSLIAQLSPKVSFVEKQLKQLSSKRAVDIPALNTNQAAFLAEMNQVVLLLEKTSSDKLNFIVWIEVLLMIFSLLIIIAEVIFIFNPIHQTAVKSLQEAEKAKTTLEESLTNLKRQNHDLEQFAYVASHDLQEPLRTVISFTQLLHRKYDQLFEKEAKEDMALIIDATRRMKALISGLLAYTKIGNKRAIKTIDCNLVVDTVKQDLSLILAEKEAKLNIEKLPKLKACETEIRQLFQNLIINALKFQKAAVKPEIVITGKELGNQYQFSVQDNGIGIMKEYQEQIFSIFKRLHTTEQYEGTGVGLAQCKKIVELHQGKIWVDSEGKEGSIFHFTIPYSLS